VEKYVWCVDSTYCVTAGASQYVNKFVVEPVTSRYGSKNIIL